MKRSLKKLVSLVLVLAISFTVCVPGFAKENNISDLDLLKDKSTKSLLEVSSNYALKWIHKITSDKSYEIGTITEIYDMNNSLKGYDVSFLKNGNQSGYAIVDFQSYNNFISEYAVDGPDLVQKLKNMIKLQQKQIKSNINNLTFKIYKNGLMDYTLKLNNDYYFSNTKGLITKSEFNNQQRSLLNNKTKKYGISKLNANFYDSIIEASERIGNMVGSEKTLSGSKTVNYVGSSSYSNQFGNKRDYGCTPTACTNLLYYLENRRNCSTLLINHNWFYTYDDIFKRLGTFSGWWAGTTLPTITLKSALKGYIQSRGYKSESVNITDLNGIQSNINYGRPIIFDYIYAGSGHSIFVYGYCKFNDGSTTHNYFTCANGWDSYPTYFAYDDIGHWNYIWEANAFTCYK